MLSEPATQSRIKIAGDDEGPLWDAGSPVEVSGWGYTSQNASNTVDTLRAATVEMISDATDRFAKCRRAKTKKKRKRCIRKVTARLAT